VVIDWATSVIAMGRVQQLAREGQQLPAGAAVDKDGKDTTDPKSVAALKPFGAHKGYGLSLINEIVAAFIGGSTPTLRSKHLNDNDKHCPCFYFQVIHPDAMSSGVFAHGKSQSDNIKNVLADIFADGNSNCVIPGQIEAQAAVKSETAGGLLFTKAEIESFNELAEECGSASWDLTSFKKAE
jgi:L-2-hydroxycarboxylate dehydrogenase (NAD+)